MRIRALVLTTLLIISSVASVIANDTVTTQDVELSGDHTMIGNYTVSHGTTLTIKPGTVIDMQNYWMEVEGTLIADDSIIMSSIQTTSPGSHNAGVWDALTITSLGNAVFDNVTISNAKSCLIVDGTLSATGLTLEHCLIGIEVAGSATINDLNAAHIDNDGIRVTGDADLSDVEFHNMSGGIHSSGDLILAGAAFTKAGVGLSLTGGTADVETLNFNSGVVNAVSISSAVSGDIDGMTGSSTNAIVSMDATAFTISNVDMSGERLVNSWSAGNLSINNAVFNSGSTETPIDIRTSGTVTLSGIDLTGQFSSLQGTYNAPWIGVSIAGSGDYIIESSSIESTDTALISSGTGTLSITDSVFTSDRLGLSFSGISSTTLENVEVNISTGGEMGLDILQGMHTFSELDINMPYNPLAANSIGINAWWCEIIAEDISVNGFANSMSVYESFLTAEDLHLLDSTQQGLYASSSVITVTGELQTKVSDSGIVMLSSSGVFRTWTSSYHEDGGVIDSDSEVTVWQFSSISNRDSDATGDGILNYGTNQQLTVDTAISNRVWEMTISFEDLTGNPVDANWKALGFSGTASAGTALLPVSEAGSEIIATYSGVGALSTSIGVQGGTHSIQVPIMPQTDWTLTAGTVVVLGPTEGGQPHLAGGNITISANAQLILQDTTLELPVNATVIIDPYGDLEGHNSHLVGDVISHSGEFGNSENSDLTISGDVLWTTCQNNIISFGINVDGDIQLDNSCKVTITSGGLTGVVTVGVGATFEIVNILEVTVLDKGEPVEGASITVQGQSVTTDAEGKATKATTSLLVDSSGSSITGLKQVTMQWGSISGLMAWETSSSIQHTFIASTISGGPLTEWLLLEKAWSPYHLSSNLVIPIGQTMTLNDGVFLRIADGVTIEVEGTFKSGNSTISSTGGARWGGLVIGDNNETSAQLLGTSLVEGSPLLTIDGYADVVLNNGLLSRTSGAEPLIRLTNAAAGALNMSSTTLSDSSSHCIEAQGSAMLHMHQVTMESCASNAIWARSLPLLIDGLHVTQKVHLDGVSGQMMNFEGGELQVDNLDGFNMSDLVVNSLNGSDNREINIAGASINGTPALVLENTAGEFSGLIIDCGGSGIGISSHHGRASAPVKISESSISSCSKGIDLHNDGESAAVELDNVSINSLVAISSDGNNLIIRDGALNGSLDINSASAYLYDVNPSSESTTFGEILKWKTHILSVTLSGNPHSADIELSVEEFWSKSVTGSSIGVALPYQMVSDSGTETTDVVNIIATSEGLPTFSLQSPYGPGESDIIEINMISNQAPNAQIIIPDDGFTVMESLPIEIRSVVSDDLDSNADLEVIWKVIIGQTEMMQLSGEWNNITDLSAGMYVLRLEVTDAQGEMSSQSISFEITLLDSDGDWINTCNSETWFDKEENFNCGPDVYDTNDDNDGVFDIRDPWPTDACASMDTDNDGQPDNLHCPPGVTTLLTADPDDDGDGIPDVSETAESNDGSSGESTIVIMLFVGIFIAAAAFMLMRGKQEVD